jgi:hypothetical protein
MADWYEDQQPWDEEKAKRVQKWIDAATIVVLSIVAALIILGLTSCAPPKRAVYYDCTQGQCVPLKEPPCVCVPDGKHDLCRHCTVVERVGPVNILVPK